MTDPGEQQRTADSLPDETFDVLIVGAGPAGSTAALHLAAKGHRVLLLDREQFPREKICGDGLISDSMKCLQRAGLLDSVRRLGHEVDAISTFSPSQVELRVKGDFITLKRRALDTLMAQKAVTHGALFCHGNVEELTVEADGSVTAILSRSRRALRARVGIIATGVRLDLLKNHGMVQQPKPSAVAMRCYVRSTYELDRMVVTFDRSITPGYAWIFPLGNGEYNLGCGYSYRFKKKKTPSLHEVFRIFTGQFPIARDLMNKAKAVSPLRGATLRWGLKGTSPHGPGNLLAIGETIATTFQMTGEGIGKAMESGELAAEVVHDALHSDNLSLLNQYPARLKADLEPRYLGYKIAEKWLSKPWLNDFVARRANKSKFINDSLAGILNETIDPRTIFSLRGILKSFFG
jgi:geranylgeranyl reductase family protein